MHSLPYDDRPSLRLNRELQTAVGLYLLLFQLGLHLLVITIERYLLPCQHGKIELQFQRFFRCIDSSDIPCVTVTAGKDNVFSGIPLYETGLVPSGGHLFHKVEADLRSIRQVVGCQSKILNGVLEKHCGGQLEYIRRTACRAAIISLVQTFFRNTPPNSMHPTVLRIKGCNVALNASLSQKC